MFEETRGRKLFFSLCVQGVLPAPLSPLMLTWLPAVEGLFIRKSLSFLDFPKPLGKENHYVLKSRVLLSSFFEVEILTYFRTLCSGVSWFVFLTGSLIL